MSSRERNGGRTTSNTDPPFSFSPFSLCEILYVNVCVLPLYHSIVLLGKRPIKPSGVE